MHLTALTVGLLTVVCCIIPLSEAAISAAEKQKVANGINALNNLKNNILRNNFVGFISTLSGYSKTAMDGVTAIVKMKRSKPAGNDADTFNALRYSFNLANNALSKPTSGFDDIKKQIKWAVVQISFGDYERTIRAAMLNLKEVIPIVNNCYVFQRKLYNFLAF
jgi:hypothetical protein